jgi:threonine synthase
MNYQSTRSRSEAVSSAQAISQGLCRDGGLFVPEEFPAVRSQELSAMEGESYQQRAERILSRYLTDFTGEEIHECVSSAYNAKTFPDGPAPVVKLGGGVFFLELWHGPTCAFKDMALQLLPHLMTRSLKKTNSGKDALILVATSGDTGKAALEGFKDVAGTKILVFIPKTVSALCRNGRCGRRKGRMLPSVRLKETLTMRKPVSKGFSIIRKSSMHLHKKA